jgi:nitrite reductase/ring-hydroxylating ferredoxin subunit
MTDDFTRTVETSKLPPGEMLTVEVAGDSVTLANVDGKYYGIGALCTHAKWDLSEGALEDLTITCAGHGTIWDLRTGKGVYDEPLDDEPLYDVKEEGGFLWVKKR